MAVTVAPDRPENFGVRSTEFAVGLTGGLFQSSTGRTHDRSIAAWLSDRSRRCSIVHKTDRGPRANLSEDMSSRHSGLALLLAMALVTFGLSVAVVAAGDRNAAAERAGAAFAQRAPGVEPSAARLRVEERPGAASQRLLKQRPLLFAFVAVLLLLPVLGRRRAVDFAQASALSVSWWLPPLGRAPPAFFHS